MSETSARNPVRTRLIGLLLLACSGVLGYLTVYKALEQAWSHADKVSYGMKAVFITPVLAVFGLMFLLFPQTEALMQDENKKLRVMGWVFVVIALGIGGAFSYWFDHELSALGYTG